jgi:hypothetical protein
LDERDSLNSEDKVEAIFGLYDGLCSALGVILAIAINGSGDLIVAAVALAVGSAVSMACGEFLSDSGGSRRKAAAMGLATLLGSISPAIPFIFTSGTIAFILCGFLSTGLCILIAKFRPGNWTKSLAVTFGVTITATALAVATSILAGAV